MSFIDKIIAKLSGVVTEEEPRQEATLARGPMMREAIPLHEPAHEIDRSQLQRDINREHEEEQKHNQKHFEPRPVPAADALHEEMVSRANELAAINKKMEEARLNKEAEERVKERVAKIREEEKAA